MRFNLLAGQWMLLGVALGLLVASVLAFVSGGKFGYLFLATGGSAAVVAMASTLWTAGKDPTTDQR